MFTEEQISRMAEKLNKKVNLPVTGEKLESMIFKKVVREIGKKFVEILPDELLQMINQPEAAFTADADLEEIKARTSEKVNEKFNIPIIGEKLEKQVIGIVVDFVIESLRSKQTLNDILAADAVPGGIAADTHKQAEPVPDSGIPALPGGV